MSEAPKPLARSADLVIEELDGEVLVYDLRTHDAHRLNATAATVWRHCDGATSVDDIAALLDPADPLATEPAVWLALEELDGKGLLNDPAEVPVSRRDAMRKLALAGAIGALALPVVKSIVAPTAAQAATCIAPGQPNPGGDPADCCSGAQLPGSPPICL